MSLNKAFVCLELGLACILLSETSDMSEPWSCWISVGLLSVASVVSDSKLSILSNSIRRCLPFPVPGTRPILWRERSQRLGADSSEVLGTRKSLGPEEGPGRAGGNAGDRESSFWSPSRALRSSRGVDSSKDKCSSG